MLLLSVTRIPTLWATTAANDLAYFRAPFPDWFAGFYEGAISVAEDTAAKLDGLLKGTAA